MKKSNLWRGLGSASALMLGSLVLLTTLAMKWEGNIDLALNVSGPSVDVSADTNYYGSDYGDGLVNDNSYNEMIKASEAHDIQTMVEGSVLVRNENAALPLRSSERRVTLFGRAVADPVYRGNSGGPQMDSNRLVTFKQALEEEGFEINETLFNAYENSSTSRIKVQVENGHGEKSSIGEEDQSFYTNALKSSYANDYNDVAIVMFSRDGGEGRDLFYNDADGISQLALHPQEADLLKMIAESGSFEKTIVLINSPYAMELDWVDEAQYGVDACLWIGGPGMLGFRGVADLLVGNADPSGHFVDTFASNSLSSPAVQNAFDHSFSNTNGHYIVEAEGIYTGYKYYETRYQDQVLGINNAGGTYGVYNSSNGWNYAEEMAYPFGYGTSYASFTQEVESISRDREAHEVTAVVKVTNNGYPTNSSYNGKSKSVVQLYVQLPYTTGNAQKSAIQLVDFAKTIELGANESDTVTITVSDYLFATYDENAVNGADSTKKGCYVFDTGDYYFAIGDNSHDALNNILQAKNVSNLFDENGNQVRGDVNKAVNVNLDTYDNVTYATSRFNDNVVSNLFEDCDLNYFYDNDIVTYLSRDNWNTFPVSYDDIEATSEMISQMNGETYSTPSDAPSYDSFTQDQEVTLKLVEMRNVEFDDPKGGADKKLDIKLRET